MKQGDKIQKVWDHLQSGKPITTKQSNILYHYQRLSDGIHKLRRRNPDVKIVMEMVANGDERYGVYYIDNDEWIEIYKSQKSDRNYNVSSNDKFFDDRFTVRITPDRIEFHRASMFTRHGIHKAYRNTRRYIFSVTSADEIQPGRYKINRERSNEDVRVYIICR